MDKDADGVRDALDSCQQTQPDLPVDAAGCAMFTGVVEGLVFAPGDHRLTVASRAVLAELVSELNRHPELVFSIDGHTDNRGAAGANLELSKQRVMAVVRYMVTNGIPPERIRPYGYGESRPLASNATVEGRERNRRIEIRVLGSLP
jgi:outer membrane protein OmpA-like peptidoglycan-associated protein